jgi:hypothetical protein
VFRIKRDDGSNLISQFPYFLQDSRDPDVKKDFDKVW